MNHRREKLFGFRWAEPEGATLLEVMVALGILATAYVALLETQSGSIRLSTYGKQITVASFLAQTKIEEVEEKLTKEGFPDMDEEEEGDFEELGYPSFSWNLTVNKVELPVGAAMEQALTSWGKSLEGGEGITGIPGELGGLEGALPSQLTDLVKSRLGGGGGLGAFLKPEMLRGNLELFTEMLEQSIREVTLTVSWEEGGPGDRLSLTTHLVQVPQAPAAAGTMPPEQQLPPGQSIPPPGQQLRSPPPPGGPKE